MNLAYRFPIIYWNCACLINDAGGDGDSTDYDKIAIALGKMRNFGIKVSLVDINKSQANFIPDEENNQIWMGLKSLTNVGDDLITAIISNRPYVSLVDFYNRVTPNKQAMIALIKGGAFDQFCSRKENMVQYIWMTCDKKKRITLQNMPGLMRYNLIPNNEQYIIPRKVYEFNRYLKDCCKTINGFSLDERAVDFLNNMGLESLYNEDFFMDKKAWDTVYQSYMDVFREWIKGNNEQILDDLNNTIFFEDWKKYADGNISSWEMTALCFYYHEHELAHVNNRKYGLVDFFKLAETPVVEHMYRNIPIYKLNRICGTCIAKNKAKSTVSLLTTSGVVNVKFNKEYFSMFDRQISIKNDNGTKTVAEKSWFSRGNMIMVQGIRRGDEFVTKNYKNSPGHQLYHIDKVNNDGTLELRSERVMGEEEND